MSTTRTMCAPEIQWRPPGALGLATAFLAGAVLHALARSIFGRPSRERAEARERAAEARVEAADRSKDEFLAMLGHELRNPLSAIQSATLLLEEIGCGGPREATATRARKVLMRQTGTLARLIDELLELADLVGGRVTLKREPIDLGEAVSRGAKTIFEAEASEDRADVHVEAAWIDGDAERIDQIIGHLLRNARRFAPPPSRIRIEVTAANDEVLLEVSDSGQGIAPELLPHVFEAFTQAPQSLERADGGLGVGLALVRHLVDLHGGSVEAKSAGCGRGSTFTLRFPRLAPSEEPRPRRPASCPHRRVVIVEDNADARDMLSTMVERMGHEVTVAADGLEGLDAVIAADPDVAFIDIGLPGMDGYEMARRIRALGVSHRVQLVALTGYGRPEDRRRAEQAGFDRHLVKPVDLAMLCEILEHLAA